MLPLLRGVPDLGHSTLIEWDGILSFEICELIQSNDMLQYIFQDLLIADLDIVTKCTLIVVGRGHVTRIQRIMTARVPIVKVIDLGTRIECDLSVENWDGILKSQLIHVISAIDERFQKLSFLVIECDIIP